MWKLPEKALLLNIKIKNNEKNLDFHLLGVSKYSR
jgi:hypothetical protein